MLIISNEANDVKISVRISDVEIDTKYVLFMFKESKRWGGGHINTMDNTPIDPLQLFYESGILKFIRQSVNPYRDLKSDFISLTLH